MISRERILEAAARVYARHGFKGATTRLIAIEAEVNEVTLFRTFGSKSALLEAVLMQHVSGHEPLTLPDHPVDPQTELSAYIEANLQRVTAMRPLLVHTMSEIDERPEAQEFACRGRHQVHDVISAYIRQLKKHDLIDSDIDISTAAVMLTGTMMSDVMGRPIVGDVYPPRVEVADRYAALFLRALGFRAKVGAPENKPNKTTARRSTTARSSGRAVHPTNSTRS